MEMMVLKKEVYAYTPYKQGGCLAGPCGEAPGPIRRQQLRERGLQRSPPREERETGRHLSNLKSVWLEEFCQALDAGAVPCWPGAWPWVIEGRGNIGLA